MFEALSLASGLAFLFDMDGVIINSTAVHTQTWEVYLERLGKRNDDLMHLMLGKRNDEIVRVLLGEDLPVADVMGHGAAKERLYREMMAPVFDKRVVGGVKEFVRAAADANIPCAVATNAEPLNAEFVLERTGLRDCFRAVVDGHQVEKPKPDPEVFLKAAAQLNVRPENCVVFEDSPGGLMAARASGAHVVCLLTTLEEAPQADLAISDFRDPRLLPWLAGLRPC